MIQNKHVLALEDEPVVAFLIEDMLRDAGAAEVTLASRVAEAVAVIGQGGIDFAVLDVNVHGERSYPVADQLLARNIPFLFASGYGDQEHPPQYKSVPTLTKPFSLAGLLSALDQLEDGAPGS